MSKKKNKTLTLINFSIDNLYREKFEKITNLLKKNNSQTFRDMIDYFILRQDKISNYSLESIDKPQKTKKTKEMDPNQKTLHLEQEEEKDFEEGSYESYIMEEEKENGDDENE